MPIRFHHTRGAQSKLVASAECSKNLNLLAHAQLSETDLGSFCGGHGVCGGDKIKPRCPKEWLSPITADEREHLTDEQLEEGWRLGCQTYPQQDGLDIEIDFPNA